MAEDKIRIEVDLDTKKSANELPGKLGSAGTKAGKKTGRNFGKAFGAATSSFIGNVGAQLFTKALSGLANAFGGVIEAAKVQEDAVNKLNSALKISGKFSEETSLSFQNFASELQQTSKFGDEVILQNAALIQSLGGLEEDGLKRATQAAVDMSAALGIDLTAAATLVGKAAAGEVGSFSRFGVIIKKGANNAETFEKALTALQTKFGGAAANELGTFSGATQQLSNNFGDVLEQIGFVITKSPVLIKIVKLLSDGFVEVGSFIAESFSPKKINDFIISLVGDLGDAVRFAGKPFIIMGNLIDVVFKGARNGIQEVLNLAINGAAAVAEVASSFGFGTALSEDINSAKEIINAATTEMREDLDQALGSAFDTEGQDERAAEWLDNLRTNLETASAIQVKFKDDSKATGEEVEKNTAKSSQNISKTINGVLVKAVAGGIQRIGASLVEGGGAFKDFGKVILGLLGDLAIQIGTMTLATGLAMTSFGDLSGTQAVIAGVGLIAVGGAIKAFAGKGGGASGGAGGSGDAGINAGVAGGFSSDGATEATSPIEETAEPQTTISINIQGDVLDSEESSLRIVNLLNEAFDQKGVALNQGIA